MINSNFLSAALAGDPEAAYRTIETCFAQQQPVLVVPDEPIAQEVVEYRELFKTLQSAFEPENRESALSILKHKYASQSSETAALARIMLVFLKSNTQIETSSTEAYPTCLKRVILYRKAIAEAERMMKPKLAEALQKDCENYVYKLLWEQVLVLDEISLLSDSGYHSARDVFLNTYKTYLLVIISFYSKDIPEKMLDCTPRELTRIAIESLKERTEFSRLQGTHNKDLFATFWLAVLQMRQDFYEFTDLPEANYLLCQLEKETPSNSPLRTWIQSKRIEMTFLDVSNSFEYNEMDREELIQKAHKKREEAKEQMKLYARSKETPRSLQILANVRLALFMIKYLPTDCLTIQFALQIALRLLEDSSSSLISLINYHLGKLLIFGDKKITPDLEKGRELLQKVNIPIYAEMAKNLLYISRSINWNKEVPLKFSDQALVERRLAIDLLELPLKPYFNMVLYHANNPHFFKGEDLEKEKKMLDKFLREENHERPMPETSVFSENTDCDEFFRKKLEAKDKELFCFKSVLFKDLLKNLFIPEKFTNFHSLMRGMISEYVIDLNEIYQSRVKGKKYFCYETLKMDAQHRTLKLTYHAQELIENILGTSQDISAYPGILKSYLEHLRIIVRKIVKSGGLQMNWVDERQISRELNVPYYVSSHVLMQGIRELINTLEDYLGHPELKHFFITNLIEPFLDLSNTHMFKYEGAEKSQSKKEIIPYLINVSKYTVHLISKISCYYPSKLTKVIYDNYAIVADKIPKDYQLELFLDVATFLKKAHFSRQSNAVCVDHEWHGALEFYIRALKVANEEEAVLIYKKIYELSPEKKEDFTALYENYLSYLKTDSKKQCAIYIALFFSINIQYRRFTGKEQEAEELRQLIEELKPHKILPFDIRKVLEDGVTISFKKMNVPQLPSETEMARHILKTLGPSYPPFEDALLEVNTPKKRHGKPNQKEDDLNQVNLELSTQTSKSNPKAKFQSTITVSIAEQEQQELSWEQNVSSTTTQAKREAEDYLLRKKQKLDKKRAKQAKAAVSNSGNALPSVQNLPSQSLSCIFLTPSEMDIFDKFFQPKTSCVQEVLKGNFDAYSFRNDVKISRAKTKKLVEALGGRYHLNGGKGSHHKGVIPCLDTNDQMVFVGQTMTVANLGINHNQQSETAPESQSETLTLPKKEEKHLKFYMVQQIREKLLSLNFSPETVKVRI